MDMWGILMLTLLDVVISLAFSTPNIVFAMADDLGWGDIQYNNGNNLHETFHGFRNQGEAEVSKSRSFSCPKHSHSAVPNS